MVKNKLVAPLLKWVGGKRQLLTEIKQFLPSDILSRTYCEPFLGGGAVLFDLKPQKAVVNDFNEELINVYRVVKEHPNELIESLKSHKNTADYFYKIRALDRSPKFSLLSPIERASRIIFLNKTCYNGLYRVNSAGEFNSPFGNYKNPNIINEHGIHAVSKYLNSADIQLLYGDYEKALETLPQTAFVYLDPPYHPVSESSNFTGYVSGGWEEKDQVRLRDACNVLDNRGIRFLLSNSDTAFIKEIYGAYRIHTVSATRAVNSVASNRGPVNELLIRNYE